MARFIICLQLKPDGYFCLNTQHYWYLYHYASAAIASSSRVAGGKKKSCGHLYATIGYCETIVLYGFASEKQLYFMVLQVNHCPLVTDVCVS